MALSSGPNIGILINGVEGENHYNELMRQWRWLDFFLQPTVLDKDLNTPPGSPANGATYIVGSAPTGAWVGHAGHLARYNTTNNAWEYLTPVAGWEVLVYDEGVRYRYGTAWVAQSYVADIGDGSATTFTLTHNMGTRDVHVRVYRNSTPWEDITVVVQRPSTNAVNLSAFSGTPTAGQYRVVITRA